MTQNPVPSEAELPGAVRGAWHRFVETYEPFRSDLYRYCRHLTRSPWDAEDLVQEALMRGFATLGQLGQAPTNPRAWLLRVASNLWIDRVRRVRREQVLEEEPGLAAADVVATREAAGTLLTYLAPQERAALVLKDVFELALDEVAEVLSTTPGAIKAALHRARGKLAEPLAPLSSAPAPTVLDAFCAAFNAGDLDGVTAVLAEGVVVEVVGATTQYGPEAARRTVLHGMLFGARRMAAADVEGGIEPRFMQGVLPVAPRVQVRELLGEWVLVHWYQHRDGEFVRAVTRLVPDADRVAQLRNYYFTPDLIADVCGALGLPCRVNGYRWWLPTS